MYECNFLNVSEMCGFLGVGRNMALRLCQTRPHHFPAVKIGNRYQADFEKLSAWKDAWYNGDFDIND